MDLFEDLEKKNHDVTIHELLWFDYKRYVGFSIFMEINLLSKQCPFTCDLTTCEKGIQDK